MLVNIQKELTQRQNNLKDVIVGLESNNDSLVIDITSIFILYTLYTVMCASIYLYMYYVRVHIYA